MFTDDDDATLTRLETRITAEIRERQANGWSPGLRDDLRAAIREWNSVYDRAAASSLPVPDQPGPFDQAAPLSAIPLFSVDSGRRALDDARRGEGLVLKHVRTVEVELLLFASNARGRSETGYRVATQAVAAFDRARKVTAEGRAEEMDPQALAAAYELAVLALDAAEAAALTA